MLIVHYYDFYGTNLLYCYFVQYIVILSDYLMVNFIRNCEKKNVYFFYLHFFFSEIDFYCNIEDFVIFFLNPDRKQQIYVLRCRSCLECVLIENLLSNLLHLIID